MPKIESNRMQILQAHNRYQYAGGEDAVVQAEKALLEAKGHKVSSFEVNNDEIRGVWRQIRAAVNTVYSQVSKNKVYEVISSFQPDIVHVHNFFPVLSPSIYDACLEARVPVVQTLHNYRLICPGALLMRDGRICEICMTGSAYKSALHGCYRDSRLGTLAVARMVQIHRRHGTWQSKVNRFIALTSFAKNKFVEAGFPESKIIVKPNFYDGDVLAAPQHRRTATALFVGRLSQEKGIDTLLEAWRQLDIPLRLLGDGPLLDIVRQSGLSNVLLMGRKSAAEVMAEMGRAAFLVMPSEWYEGFPMVVAEAFAHGLPVIATRLGSLAEIVHDGVTGLHFEAGNAEDLAAKVKWAVAHPEEMSNIAENARREYEEKYTPEVNYRQLMEIYQSAIKQVKN